MRAPSVMLGWKRWFYGVMAVGFATAMALNPAAGQGQGQGQGQGFDDGAGPGFKAGDKVELRSGQSGVVISVEGAKVKILLTVPAVDLVIPGQPRQPVGPRGGDPRQAGPGRGVPGQGVPGQGVPGQGVPGQGTPGQGFNDPNQPQGGDPQAGAQVPPHFGAWLAHDRAFVIKSDSDFRLFFTDPNGVIRADDGKYTLDGDMQNGYTFYFSARGKEYVWRVTDFKEDSMTLSHETVGVRTFQRVTPNFKHPLAGTYDVNFSGSRGSRGTATMYLYQDGMYIIDEHSTVGGRDRRQFGGWVADFEKATLTIQFGVERKLSTLAGSVRVTGPTGFAWSFAGPDNETYTYNCRRRVTRRAGGGQGFGGQGGAGGGQGGFGGQGGGVGGQGGFGGQGGGQGGFGGQGGGGGGQGFGGQGGQGGGQFPFRKP